MTRGVYTRLRAWFGHGERAGMVAAFNRGRRNHEKVYFADVWRGAFR